MDRISSMGQVSDVQVIHNYDKYFFSLIQMILVTFLVVIRIDIP